MSWRGSWGSPGIYQYGDVVTEGGTTYVCVAVSGSVAQQPSLNPAVWEFLSGSAEVAKISLINNTTPLPAYPGQSGIVVPVTAPTPSPYPITNAITVDPTHLYRITLPLTAVFNTDATSIGTLIAWGNVTRQEVGFYLPTPPSPSIGFVNTPSTIFQPPSTSITVVVLNYSTTNTTQILPQSSFVYLEDLGPA